MAADPSQRAFDFHPIEATPEERERSRRLALQWTLEEAAEDFHQLPGETMTEFTTARAEYLQALETFGPDFPRPPCAAWQIVQGERRPPRAAHQMTLPFEGPRPIP